MKFTPHYSSSAGNLYTVSDGDTNVIIDPGVSPKKMAAAINISEYDACLISHAHTDHCNSKSILDLHLSGVPIYSGVNMGLLIECSSIPFILKRRMIGTFIHDILKIGDMYISPIPLDHNVDCCGYLIDSGNNRLVFMVDTFSMGIQHILGITYLCVECNHDANLIDISNDVDFNAMNNHMSIQKLESQIANIDRSRLKEVHLLHLSDRNSDAADFKKRIQRITGCPVHVAPK